MGFYSADQIEAMSQTTVRMATLAELRLTSGTVRVFAGAGVLKAAGFTWTGIGQIARIEGLKALRGAQASQVRVLMPAVPITLPEFPGVNFVDQIFSDVAEVKNRLIVFYSQLMDEREQAIRGVAGYTDVGRGRDAALVRRLRERGVIRRPEDLGIDPLDADRSTKAGGCGDRAVGGHGNQCKARRLRLIHVRAMWQPPCPSVTKLRARPAVHRVRLLETEPAGSPAGGVR